MDTERYFDFLPNQRWSTEAQVGPTPSYPLVKYWQLLLVVQDPLLELKKD
jgi:hypothetical protein